MKRVWSVIYSNKKNSPKPNNADFWYFTDKTIIKTCNKIHFVMNLFPVSSHIWLHWPDYCFLKKFYCIIYDTTCSKTIFIRIRKKKKIKINPFDAKNLMNVDQLKLYKTKLSQHYEYTETVPLRFTVIQWIGFYYS